MGYLRESRKNRASFSQGDCKIDHLGRHEACGFLERVVGRRFLLEKMGRTIWGIWRRVGDVRLRHNVFRNRERSGAVCSRGCHIQMSACKSPMKINFFKI